MAGRRTSLASLAAAKVDDVPGKSDPLLLTLPLTKLVPTRFNPRRNFGTDEELKVFGLVLRRRQLQPAVVVSRTGYLKLWPDEEENVKDTPYVIANGERRFRGSLAAGLLTLNVVHNEDVAASRADFLDAVLSENNDREDLDPIERAIGIETMVLELGGADKVAEHYEKSKGWVSQQRKLLKLTPALQALVSAGELPVRVGRDIAGLPQGEQAAAWAAELDQRAAAKALPRKRITPSFQPSAPTKLPESLERSAPEDSAPTEEAPNNSQPEPDRKEIEVPDQGQQAPPSPGPRFTAVNQTPELKPDPEESRGQRRPPLPDIVSVQAMPWGDPQAVAHIVGEWMSEENRRTLGKLLLSS
ncbi:ParB/RepB/Spo0J family partition protein [Streptomyces scopuliridis]|uniref:ParB/RepB/Spo0J family partition protein n=1 Tax=Streptomyces scopuliridis TaxID=452529 RepID=UPI00341D2EF2